MMTALLNDWGAGWSSWFLASTVQNTIFVALVFVALHFLRRAPARVRALIATIGIVKLAVPPFVPAVWLRSAAPERIIEPVSTLLFPFNEAGATVAPAGGTSTGLSVPAILLIAWFGVALGLVAVSMVQTLRLARDLRDSDAVDEAELPMEIRRAGLSVRCCRRIAMPLTRGLRSRVVYVPTAWRNWPRAMRRAVLLHEMEHLKRRDGVVQALEILVQAAFFFHPLVLLLVRRARMLREMACDDASVADDPHARLDYSRFLVSLAESNLGRQPAVASASALARRRSELLGRVTYQIKESVMHSVPKRRLAASLLVLLLLALPLSMVFGESAQTPPPPPPKGEKVVTPDPAAEAPPPPPPTIHVAFDADDLLRINGTSTAMSSFGEMIALIAAEKGDDVVIRIANDGASTMGTLHTVQKVLLDLGLTRIVYAGDLGEAVPMMLPPEKAVERLKAMPEEQLLRVKIDSSGVVTVGGEKTASARIEAVVSGAIDGNPHLIVIVDTDEDTPYGAVVQVLDSLHRAGARRITIGDPTR